MLRSLLFALVFAAASGCGGAAAPAASSDSSPTHSKQQSIDELRDVDGTSLGTAADKITDLAPVTILGRAVRKRKTPKPVFGFVPADASYTFDGDDKLSGAIWSMARADCDKLGDAVKTRFGPPNDGDAWQGAEIRLGITRIGSDCALVWGVRANFELQPPKKMTSTVVGRFGEAVLGAPLKSFKKLEKREANAGTVYYRPATKAYEGIALSRLSYAFREDKLASVTFDVAAAKDCAKMLETLKKTFGPTPSSAPNMGGGTSYTWTGEDWTLKHNDFGTQCSGILFGGHSPF